MKTCKKCSGLFEGRACKPCRNAHMREWNKANPDYDKKRNAQYRIANPEKYRLNKKASNEKNKVKVLARAIEYRRKNPEKCAKAEREWHKKNIEKTRIVSRLANQKRREKSKVNSLSKDIIEKLLKLQNGKCPCCKHPLGKNYHIDHIMPFALGGLNIDSNVQLLRQKCNNQKHAKHPIDFMQSRGYLL
jgi:hypothetical protein